MFRKESGLRISLANVLFVIVTLLIVSCQNQSLLPKYGERDFDENGDTVFHVIPDFSFTNQFDEEITQNTYSGKIYIADFFFTTCPGICPIMTGELTRVQEALREAEVEVMFLSHTVDPEHDSTSVLLAYGKRKGADFTTWNFVTGSKSKLYHIAETYLVVANHNPAEEMEFVHSDKLVLVDKSGRIRGLYSGIETREVDQLIKDVKTLVKEYE